MFGLDTFTNLANAGQSAAPVGSSAGGSSLQGDNISPTLQFSQKPGPMQYALIAVGVIALIAVIKRSK